MCVQKSRPQRGTTLFCVPEDTVHCCAKKLGGGCVHLSSCIYQMIAHLWRDLGGQGQAAVFRIMGAVPREKPIFITKASYNIKY